MTHEVLVIGAGPAGSITARELARRGARVLLVDRAIFPRQKVCGSCLNGTAVDALERLGLGHVLEGARRLDRVLVAAGSRSSSQPLPRGRALSRTVLDERLAAAAMEAGVVFRHGVAAGEIARESERARVTIRATGLAASKSRPKRNSRLGAGVVLTAESVPDYYHDSTIFMATGRGGYVGLVRVENDCLDVAAAFDPAFVKSSGGLGPAAVAILRGVRWPVPCGLADSAWKGTPALTRSPARFGGPGWFAVGDAAGYVEPFTGEGMAWAILSAAALAPIALRSLRTPDADLVREWEAAHRRVVGRRQRMCRIASRVLRSPLLTSLAVRVLNSTPSIARLLVATLNRPAPQGLHV